MPMLLPLPEDDVTWALGTIHPDGGFGIIFARSASLWLAFSPAFSATAASFFCMAAASAMPSKGKGKG